MAAPREGSTAYPPHTGGGQGSKTSAAGPPADGDDGFLDLLSAVNMGMPGPTEEYRSDLTDLVPQTPSPPRPVGNGEYVVKQGDCVASIALETGHFWQTIWDDGANAEVKAARKDPYVLLPGDRLHIPPLRQKWAAGATELTHCFRRKGVPERLHLRLFDHDHKPIANKQYTLVVDDTEKTGVTTASGRVIASIPPDAREGRIIIADLGVDIELSLGALDPVTELTGVQARLNNLGYEAGSEDGEWSEALDAALRAFQEDQRLPVTGRLDDETRHRLSEQCAD